jgi:hypothetical protein
MIPPLSASVQTVRKNEAGPLGHSHGPWEQAFAVLSTLQTFDQTAEVYAEE